MQRRSIRITRGAAATVSVDVYDDDNTAKSLTGWTVLTFTLFRHVGVGVTDATRYLTKTSGSADGNTVSWSLSTTDTDQLHVGEYTYVVTGTYESVVHTLATGRLIVDAQAAARATS